MNTLAVLEELYVEMFNHNIKGKVAELKPRFNVDEVVGILYEMGRLDDIVKIYNLNRYIRLFETQDLLDAIKKDSNSDKVLNAI